jgi:hypothetical protein
VPKQLSPWQPWAQPGTDKADYPHEGYKPGYMDHLIDQKKTLEAEKEELVHKHTAHCCENIVYCCENIVHLC